MSGGETSGFVLLLDESSFVAGGVDRLDVESDSVDLSRYLNQAIEITGDVTTRWGPERGHYQVVTVLAIKAV